MALLACSRSTPSAPEAFPDTDIIFQVSTLWDEWNSDRESLGFVNADGSDLTYIGGWRGYHYPPVLPVITGDGSLVVFRVVDLPGHASNLVLWPEGGPPVSCKVGMGTQRAALMGEQARAVTDLVGPGGRLAVVDLMACVTDPEKQAESILTVGEPDTTTEGAMAPSRRVLAYVEWNPDERVDVIVLRDIDTGDDKRLHEGIAPAWSPDGQTIAFAWVDGIYTADVQGEDIRRVVNYTSPGSSGHPLFHDWWPPLPSWSPDGRWLVYHKCILPAAPATDCGSSIDDYAIFKVNVETGEEIKILDGGLNPYWRWKPQPE
jgi:hypothetical protein